MRGGVGGKDLGIKSTIRLAIISVGVLVLVLVLILIFRGGNTDKIDNYSTIITAKVKEGSNNWEIHKSIEDKLVIIVRNGEIEDKKRFDIEESELEQNTMNLPELEAVKGADIISREKEYSRLVWNASQGESVSQVKFFMDMGYEEVMRAQTQKFIELIMRKENSIKRIIIVQGQLSVADIEEYEFGGIYDYIY